MILFATNRTISKLNLFQNNSRKCFKTDLLTKTNYFKRVPIMHMPKTNFQY